MQSLRYNPFNQIHKGLRALLYNTALQIQHTDFSDDYATRQTLEKVELVIWLFEGHAHVEDTMVFPLIEKHAPEVVTDFETQHVEDHHLSEVLVEAVTQCKKAATIDAKFVAARDLLLAFNDFLAFNVKHMNQEETIVNSHIWEHYSDDELLEHGKEIVKSIPPEKNGHYSKWMLLGLNNHEIAVWFTTIKNMAPLPVVNMFYELAEKELDADRWNIIKNALNEDVLIA